MHISMVVQDRYMPELIRFRKNRWETHPLLLSINKPDMHRIITTIILLSFNLLIPSPSPAQLKDRTVSISVDYRHPLQPWDGFGVNYVETSQTSDYGANPQDYGGFSILEPMEKELILDSIFGENGLKADLLKMFLDPWHQQSAGGSFDHSTTTSNMLFVAREAQKRISARNGRMQIISTLYGPPPYMTLEKQLRGKRLDPDHTADLSGYLVEWARFLRDDAGLPLNYLSLHNEGEDWGRMPIDGLPENESHEHLDYNMYWSPGQTIQFLHLLRPKLDSAGLQDVQLTNGEYTNWYRFNSMGYAHAILNDPVALGNLGLITSHGFYNGMFWRLFSGTTNHGTWQIQQKRPDLHAWTTSISWMNSSIDFANLIYYHIYLARVNAVIPWAFIQRPGSWDKGDPNPGNAVTVFEDGSYRFTRGYYFYKQFTRAGRPGMRVVPAFSMDPSILVLGFTSPDSLEPDSFVLVDNGYSFNRLADGLELRLRSGDKETTIMLSHKASAAFADGLPDGTQLVTEVVEGGYRLEASIPWNSLPGYTPEMLPQEAEIVLKSGSEDVENIVGWTNNMFRKEMSDTGHFIENEIKVDAKEEDAWQRITQVNVDQPRLENAQFILSGKVRVAFSPKGLNIFAEITDATNSPNKEVVIKIPGSRHKRFNAYRTSYDGEKYSFVGSFQVDEQNEIKYSSPGLAVTTFLGVD